MPMRTAAAERPGRLPGFLHRNANITDSLRVRINVESVSSPDE
jgi:hypothetical protein